MKDNYTLKEILLGLREEQMKIVNNLENLKSCLWEFYEEKNSFFSVNPEDNTIIYFYKCKDKSLKRNVIIPFEFKKNFDGDFTNFYFLVKLMDQERFNLMCENILANEFVNNSSFCIKTNHGTLHIKPTYIHYLNNNLKLLKIDHFTYLANYDLIESKVTTLKRNKKEIFENLFNLEFSKEYFSEYLQSIIDSSLETKKEIIIPSENSLEKNMSFYLNQERENYVLVKKKK